MVKQLSVFIENEQGRLSGFTELLVENNINLAALTIADTTDFGILRIIAEDTQRALRIIRGAGYTVNMTDVLALAVPDKAGGLAGILEVLEEGCVGIEYVYSSVKSVNGDVVIIFRVDETEKAVSLLTKAGITPLTGEQLGIC